MCGIVGIVSQQPVAGLIVTALKRLEYRGYDSAGIATLESGHLTRCRAEGKLARLEEALVSTPLGGRIGIGHTRWATHGRATVANAHPHASDVVAVVHNGIIENFRELRFDLVAGGTLFESDTDSEVVAHLVTREMRRGVPAETAVLRALGLLKGAFALVFLFEGQESFLIGARRGSPLAVGHGAEGMFFGSDALALNPFTDTITYLEEGDVAIIDQSTVRFLDDGGRPVERPRTIIPAGSLLVDKGEHRHFMAKEIHEQPEVLARTIAANVDLSAGRLLEAETVGFDWNAVDRITITACGTAYIAGLVAKYWFERFARLSVEIDVASEFRYRTAPMPKGGLMLLVSQSGETADTLACLRYARQHGQHVAAVVNVPTSTMAREADFVIPTHAGQEIGVASTKAFTCQLAALAALALRAAAARETMSPRALTSLIAKLSELPGLIGRVLLMEQGIADIAAELVTARSAIYLGRGTSYPLALEGALKLKEISYIHAEGYSAGELKHGPIALIDPQMPVIVLAPSDHVLEKTASNVQEVAARGGRIVLIGDEAALATIGIEDAAKIVMPEVDPDLAPIVYAVPLQLLAYHAAVRLGNDVDQPRNLAKSVTVE